jgi:diguanylate cyclase
MAAAPKPMAPALAAKGALRRLAQAQLEPTPENYARAYADETGTPAPAPAAAAAGVAHAAETQGEAEAWSMLVERLSKLLERGGRQWTAARRKESLRRVLDGSRSDAARRLQRMQSLLGAWESDQPSDPAQTGAADPPIETAGVPAQAAPPTCAAVEAPPAGATEWQPLVSALEGTVRAGLGQAEQRAAELADALAALAAAVAAQGPSARLLEEIVAVCASARGLFGHRHRLVEQLAVLCRELGAGLTELAEDESWARGQCASLQVHLEGEPTVRGVRAAAAVLAEARQQQQQVRAQRQAARDALRQLIHDMVLQVGELGEHTGRFQRVTQAHAQAIEQADSLEELAGVVRAMLEDNRVMHAAVARTQERLQADQSRAGELETRVRELEDELRRLSQEVSTDVLTQVANRRGLMQEFEAESARCERTAGPLAVGLIDIDNFKKLNDTLGHAAGDVALKSLAAAVRDRLRPADHLARFGGEEFVLLLPETGVDEAKEAMTRLQRSLTEALFMHEGREVFVTFSGGVTAWRPGESLQAALERADQALYEAKRTGKNRTCVN